MWRNNSSASLSTAPSSSAADGDTDGLPAGWTRKESKTQKGRYYYISPEGKTQWTPPNAPTTATNAAAVAASATATATASTTTTAGAAPPPAPVRAPPVIQASYNWVTEVEIEFGEGRLGVSLREVRQFDTTPYPLFQAEVDDLPKINGKAGPAELYNWSVKPHKRLTIGMRVTGIEEQGLAGLTYKEVVDRLKKAPRPLRIRFADVERGTVEDNPQLALISEQEARASTKSSAYLQQKQAFTRVLVTSELHTELWTIETNKLQRSMRTMKKKWDAVSSEFNVLNERRLELRKENERLVGDKQTFETMIKHLKLQEIHAMENPELVQANALAKKNAGLTEDITKMAAGNKRLRKERVTLQTALDELEGTLAKLDAKAADEDDGKGGDDELFFGIDLTAPPREQVAAFRKKLRFMEEELSKEQRKAAKVQREMEQLNRHFAKLSSSKPRASDREPSTSSSASTSSSSSSSMSKGVASAGGGGSSGGGDGGSSKSKASVSPEVARLEAKILELRKQQRSVVDTMSKAAQVGDQDLAKECQRRRHAIKEELRQAQDELHKLKGGSSGSSKAGAATGSSSSSSGSSSRPAKSSSSSQQPTVSRGSSSSNNTGGGGGGGGSSQQQQQASRAKKADKMPTLVGFLDKGPTEWSERGLISNMKAMRGARERWCELTPDGFLKYYKRRGDPEVRGEIDLSDRSLEVVCEDMKRGREFVLSTSSQQSHFFTKSTPELEKWVKTLRAAHAYLVAKSQKEALAKKAEVADKRSAGGSSGLSREAQRIADSFPEEDEQFYGRATLGF
ncbi:hypothetical protein PybrP1_001226 [[Pythium] brassicae (nom. inval.)]|nr:hypothetical protein PybrP1_001226 [[Pythium] brassicae (nom. inval.)]